MEVMKRFNSSSVAAGYKRTTAGVIPVDWLERTVGELIQFQGGSQPEKTHFRPAPQPGYVRMIQIRDYKSDRFEVYVPQALARRFCNETDIMIGRYGPPVFQILRGLAGAYNVALIKAVPLPDLDPNYAYFFLKSEQLFSFVEKLSRRSSGQTGVDLQELKNYPLPLPPLRSEQAAISAALTDADALIDSLEQLLTKKRQIKQGAIQELLSGKRRLPGYETPWIRRPFSEVASVSRERVNPSALNTPPLCVELEHLQPGTGRLVGDAFESQQAATKSVFRQGDVLFGKLRAYLRKYWLAEFEGVCSTEIWVLRPRGELASNAYLFYTIQRDDFIDVASNAYGTHMPRSDWKIVSEFSLSLPGDGMEQAAIAQVLFDMDTEISTIESRLTKAHALKQAMAQALLTGRIRLPVDTMEPTP